MKRIAAKYYPPIGTKKKNLLIRAFATFDMTAKNAAEFAGVSRNTANIYYNLFREKIADHFRTAPRFMGEVEMDQAFFGRSTRSPRNALAEFKNEPGFWRTIKKNNRARKNNKVMVFGIMQRGGRVYTHIIKDASRDTLFPIIHMVVEPGTTIYTDKWTSFETLGIDGYKHRSVNHSKGPIGLDGEHTGNIDNFWGAAKHHLGHFRGISRRTFPLHLKECEARYNMREAKKFLNFVKRLMSPRKRKYC